MALECLKQNRTCTVNLCLFSTSLPSIFVINMFSLCTYLVRFLFLMLSNISMFYKVQFLQSQKLVCLNRLPFEADKLIYLT